MKNYKDSDYALNKFSANIVYRFADGIREVTLADYLTDNPANTEADFSALKSLSDEIYLKQANDENAQTNKNVSVEVLHSDALNIVPSPEDVMMDNLNAAEIAEKHRAKLELAYRIMDRLSEKQRRRYVQYHALGLTLRQIANAEGITHKAIHKSIIGVEKKIKKYFPRE